MKRSCKHVNITDPETIRPWVVECIKRHKKRYDFRDLLLRHGLNKFSDYAGDFKAFKKAQNIIRKEATA